MNETYTSYPIFKKLTGLPLFIATMNSIGVYLRFLLLLSLALHQDMKFFTEQGLTIDFCAYGTVLYIFFCACLVNWKSYIDVVSGSNCTIGASKGALKVNKSQYLTFK